MVSLDVWIFPNCTIHARLRRKRSGARDVDSVQDRISQTIHLLKGDNPEASDQDRVFLGGSSTLRGFDFRGAANVALHLAIGPDGVDPKVIAVHEHAIELRPDGTAWCGDMQLLFPGSTDRRLLEFHLTEIAGCMPRRDHDRKGTLGGGDKPLEVFPLRLELPDGRLEIWIDEQASIDGLQRELKICCSEGVYIWKLSLVPTREGALGEPIYLDLPIPVPDPLTQRPGTMHAFVEPIGVFAPGAMKVELSSGPIQVTVDGQGRAGQLEVHGHVKVAFASSRRPVKYSLSYPLDGEFPIAAQGSDPAGAEDDFGRLSSFLGAEHAARSGRLVVIIPDAATRWVELALLLEALIQSGFRGIDVMEARGP